MKKFYLSVAVIFTLASSMALQSCLGSFALTRKVWNWNQSVGDKWVNELVFIGFCILPVYPLSAIADAIVINSIEFWSGDNPVETYTKVIDGKDAKYLVKCDKTGYLITNLSDKSVTRLNFNEQEKSWSIDQNGQDIKFMEFVDDTHVKMITPDGSFQTVELSERGVYAYEQMVKIAPMYALK